MATTDKTPCSKDSWDFATANTKGYTHCYHNYPAMMIPQIADRLLDLYGQNAKRLMDPYCGTGTSLVEANLRGINAFGIDLNPLACLIAKTKTLKIDREAMDSYISAFGDFALSQSFGTSFNAPLPCASFKNIDFWFKKNTIRDLSIIKDFIEEIENPGVKDFFKIAFSETVRESSLTRNSEFKLYRMKPEQIDNFSPDVWTMLASKLSRNRKGYIDFIETLATSKTNTRVTVGNSVDGIKCVSDASIDIVITSPPYGDSRTTVAYGQFSRLANQWLNVENAAQIDNALMGGKPKSIATTKIPILDTTTAKICAIDPKRARDVFSFYADYAKSIGNVARKIKRGGYACYVVGNRRVKGVLLPTDEITRAIFETYGFEFITSHTRNIPRKRMPSQNSPSNIAGAKSDTMTKEHIIVMQRT